MTSRDRYVASGIAGDLCRRYLASVIAGGLCDFYLNSERAKANCDITPEIAGGLSHGGRA